MKSECEIRVMRANIEAEYKNLKRECLDLGIKTIESELIFRLYEEKLRILDDILETKENICYG